MVVVLVYAVDVCPATLGSLVYRFRLDERRLGLGCLTHSGVNMRLCCVKPSSLDSQGIIQFPC